MAQTDYIRPVADISLGHTTNQGSTGFNLVNELASDEDSTYITASGNDTLTTQTSQFRLSGDIGSGRRITDVKAVVVAKASTTSNAQTYARQIQVNVGSSSSEQKIATTNYTAFEYPLLPSDIQYSGSIATAELTLTTSIQTQKNTTTFNITQIYIEIIHKLDARYTVTVEDRGAGSHTGGDGEYWDEDPVSMAFTSPTGGDIRYLLVNNEDRKSELKLQPEIVPKYTVTETASGASYGFVLSNDYWMSQNKGQANSAAVCQVNFDMAFAGQVQFGVINYAQSRSDYGLIGAVDQTLRTTYTADTGTTWSGYSNNSATERSVTVQLPAGQHFIQLKFLKNNRTNQYNDDLRWRITSLTFTQAQPKVYQYDISSLDSDKDIKAIYNDYYSTYHIKNNGIWQKVRLVFQKIDGKWVEISEAPPEGWTVNDTVAPPDV